MKNKLKKTALRIDDVGASSKKYEVYSKKLKGIGNFGFLKYMPYFKAWGPYRELTVEDWREIYTILEEYKAVLTVGITAAWVERNGKLVPFPEKFSEQAEILKFGIESGLIEIANHGLTHCVVGEHLPRILSSNRKYHREFWDWLSKEIHDYHISESQNILQNYFDVQITTLIPPGNVFSAATIRAAKNNGIKRINCNNPEQFAIEEINIIDNKNIIAFHDRELVLYGLDWLRKMLEKNKGMLEYRFVRDV